ncbi:hypothetical protein B0T18DRAFT_95589 [Schizothecium vesticola]|uniref:Uncharacterized protein n=1 Tax=Schizothecium vesticola TaxID=314040 RepID=A0AA40F0K7_9PEZI|nr:hypothetical protein B0T18DRAFT_95589 [Schizothecium vesticola]
MTHHDQSNNHHSFNPLENVSFGEGIDLAVGLTATALTADQLVKLAHSKKHTTQHLVRGGLTGGLATAAFAMMTREHRDKHETQQRKKEQLEHQRRRSLVERPHPHPLFYDDSDDDERDGRAAALATQQLHAQHLLGAFPQTRPRTAPLAESHAVDPAAGALAPPCAGPHLCRESSPPRSLYRGCGEQPARR